MKYIQFLLIGLAASTLVNCASVSQNSNGGKTAQAERLANHINQR